MIFAGHYEANFHWIKHLKYCVWASDRCKIASCLAMRKIY